MCVRCPQVRKLVCSQSLHARERGLLGASSSLPPTHGEDAYVYSAFLEAFLEAFFFFCIYAIWFAPWYFPRQRFDDICALTDLLLKRPESEKAGKRLSLINGLVDALCRRQMRSAFTMQNGTCEWNWNKSYQINTTFSALIGYFEVSKRSVSKKSQIEK